MEAGHPGAAGVNVPLPVAEESKAERESATIPSKKYP